MTDFLVIPTMDHTGAKNVRDIRLPVIVAATAPQMVALDAAILAVVDGGLFTSIRETITSIGTLEAGQPSVGEAQREVRGLFTYQDTVTLKTYQFSIGGFDEALAVSGTEDIDFTHATVADFKVGFDIAIMSPVGNAVSLLSGKVLGANV